MSKEAIGSSLQGLTLPALRAVAEESNPLVVADRLTAGGLWFRACAQAAAENIPLEAVAGLGGATRWPIDQIAVINEQAAGRARALACAAEAARYWRDGHAASAARFAARAGWWWHGASVTAEPDDRGIHDTEETPSSLAAVFSMLRQRHDWDWAPVHDLTQIFLMPSRPRSNAVQLKVPLHLARSFEVGTLAVERVLDIGEELWPDPATMAYVPIDPATTQATSAAFRWARGRERFPRGAGARWRILGEGGVPLADLGTNGAALGGAMGVALGYLFGLAPKTRRGPDPSALVIAMATPSGMLQATEDPDAVAAATDRQLRVIVSGGDAKGEQATRIQDRSRPSPQLTTASTVVEAIRSARPPRRKLLPALLATLLLLTLVGGAGGALWGRHANRQAEHTRRQKLAGELAALAQARREQAPDQALLLSLAGHRLDPAQPGVLASLLTAVYGNPLLEWVLPNGSGEIAAMAFSQRGTLLAAAHSSRTVAVWDASTGRAVATLRGSTGRARALAFAPDGRLLASAGDDGAVALWDTTDAQHIRLLRVAHRHNAPIRALAFASNSRLLAAAGDDGRLVLLATTGGRRVQVFHAHKGPIRAVAFSPDGRRLISAGDDRAVTSRATTAPRHLQWRTTFKSQPSSAAIRKDGRTVYVTEADGRLHFLAASTGNTLQKALDTPAGARVEYVAAHDRLLVATAGVVLRIRADPDAKLGDVLNRRDGQYPGTDGVAAASRDGRHIATLAPGGAILLHQIAFREAGLTRDLLDAQAVYPLPGSQQEIVVSGGTGALGGLGGRVLLVDHATGSVLSSQEFVPQLGPRISAFSPSARAVAAATQKRRVRIWALRARRLELAAELTGPAGARRATVAFDEVHHTLFVSWGPELVMYDISDPNHPVERSRYRPASNIGCLAPDPTGASVFACLAEGPAQGLVQYLLDDHGNIADSRRVTDRLVITATAMRDGTVVSGSFSGAVLLHRFRRPSWENIELTPHRWWVTDLATHQDLVVSAGRDFHILVTHAQTARLLVDIRLPSPFFPGVLWASGPRLYSADPLSGIRFELLLDRELLRRRACQMGGWDTEVTVRDAWPEAPKGLAQLSLCKG